MKTIKSLFNSILKGASSFSIFPLPRAYNFNVARVESDSNNGLERDYKKLEADWKALQSDWAAVGKHMTDAMGQYEKENNH